MEKIKHIPTLESLLNEDISFLMEYAEKGIQNALKTRTNPQFVKDLCQETWIRAHNEYQKGKRPSFSTQGHAAAWCYRIAHNLTIDRIRKGKNELLNSAVSAESVSYALKTKESDAYSSEEIINNIQFFLRKLQEAVSDEQWNIVKDRCNGTESGKLTPHKEIAEKTGNSINTVLGRMRYLRKVVTKLLEEEYPYLELPVQTQVFLKKKKED